MADKPSQSEYVREEEQLVPSNTQGMHEDSPQNLTQLSGRSDLHEQPPQQEMPDVDHDVHLAGIL